jgi:hypothetical protein
MPPFHSILFHSIPFAVALPNGAALTICPRPRLIDRLMDTPKPLFSYSPHRAPFADAAPFLPMSRGDMDALGWDVCDIVLVTGDAYVDHPSSGMALIGRLLEAQGFRVGKRYCWRKISGLQS